MTKNDVLDYVMTTPHNTNRAVLSSILDSYVSSDNKQEIEFLGTENGVFTPKEGKVFNKVTVNVPIPEEIELSATENTVYTPAEGKVYKKVTVNVPAPPSDLTTAIVTVVVQEGGGLDNNYLVLPVIGNDVIGSEAIYNAGTYTVPLYKGTAKGYSYGGVDSVSGDCTVSDSGIIITGDCTITFTP